MKNKNSTEEVYPLKANLKKLISIRRGVQTGNELHAPTLLTFHN